MADFPGNNFAFPGVYVRTQFENPIAGTLSAVKVPVLIGTGNEVLFQGSLEVVRGSSSTVDQLVVKEDMAGRSVVEITATGQVVLGDSDGVRNRVQVRNFPIVTGDGTGTTSNNRQDVQAFINGDQIVVLAVDGARGVVTLAQEPASGDQVQVTYQFNRTDTLTTDDLSDQVTAEAAAIRGEIGLGAGEFYVITAGVTDELKITIDQLAEVTITLPAGSFTATQAAALIQGQAVGSLSVGTFLNNEGDTAIILTADNDIRVGDGSANGIFGLPQDAFTARNRVFKTFQRPIVDGSNGGITTTDPARVTVLVDNVQVTPSAVDGGAGTVTLDFAPAAGQLVSVTYFFNSWQDTFDYLAHRGIIQILQAGITPDRSDFINEVDFVLKDDLIVWGTASLISEGQSTEGFTPFGTQQVSATLVDNKAYLEVCSPVTDTSVTPPVDSRRVFQLPFQPTTGNGRSTPLGASLFGDITNGRIDLPTERPDLVTAYWGFSLQDAIDRGPVTVLSVDSTSSQVTLAEPIAVGATVFATFYYNTIVDDEYTLQVAVPGSATVGTYTMRNDDGTDLFDAYFGTKSAGLAGIAVQFPSGSELLPDSRIEGNPNPLQTGPVEEVVTITFDTSEATPALHTILGNDPYFPIVGSSDHARILVDAADLASGAAGVDVANPTGVGTGFFASLIGDEIVYDAASGATTYDITAANNTVSLTVDDRLVSATVTPSAGLTLADFVTAINTAAVAVGAEPRYVSATRFTGPVTVVAGEYDDITLHYTGDVTGVSGNHEATIAPGTYNSVTALVSAINTALSAINGAALLEATVTAFADADARIVFEMTSLGAGDAAGFIEFITDATPAEDFSTLAGIDTAAATGGTQTKLYNGPIARRFTVGAGALNHDRLILRNRLVPGSGSLAPYQPAAQASLTVQGTSASAETGLAQQETGLGGFSATVQPATILAEVGFVNGQGTGFADAQDSQPLVIFYDGTGTQPVNNVFKFTMDGTSVTVVFTASAAGTATALGPGSIAGTVIEQIAAEMSAQGFGASAAAVLAAGLVRQEGAGFRLVSARDDQFSSVVIGSGNANGEFSLADDTSDLRDPVDVRVLASALMSHHSSSGTFASVYMLDFATPAATYFAAEALAFVATDNVGLEYLALQSQSTGSGSSIAWSTPTTDDILAIGTNLLDTAGDGAVGEDGISGFYVTSSDPADGSGSADTSVFNTGTGQDGVVGQTYRDLVTGLTLSVLEREGGFGYPDGETFTIVVSKTFVADSNIPRNAIGGVELLVTNTAGTNPTDTAIIETFKKSGNEPAVGDLYYVTYSFVKDDFSTQIFTKLNVIEQTFGTRSSDNPVSLAAFLMLINGAVGIAIKQVPKDEGSAFASETAYLEALNDLTKPLPGGLLPDVLVPLKGDSLSFFQLLGQHVDVQSSLRFRQERTAIIGLTPSVTPQQVGGIAQQLSNQRLRLVYPDSVELTIVDALNQRTTELVEGFYLAAALAGSVVDPNLDVATPWTNRFIVGFDQLGRKLDPVEQQQAAVSGVTVLAEKNPNLVVLQGLTTDVSNILTKLPTIILIADEVQQRSRATLENFIGVKFIPGILTQVEGRLAKTFSDLVAAQIVSAYGRITAEVDVEDPTTANVEAFYSPVFPLLFILVTFNLRSSL